MSLDDDFEGAIAAQREQEIADRVEQDRIEALQFVLSDRRGRAYVWDLLERCRVFGASFSPEQAVAAFNEGRRDIGIRTLNDILAVRSSAFAEMQAENVNRYTSYHVTEEQQS